MLYQTLNVSVQEIVTLFRTSAVYMLSTLQQYFNKEYQEELNSKNTANFVKV